MEIYMRIHGDLYEKPWRLVIRNHGD